MQRVRPESVVITKNPIPLPSEIWQQVANYLDKPSIANLRLTMHLIADDKVIHEAYYLKIIATIFDYKDEAEIVQLINESGMQNRSKTDAYKAIIKWCCTTAEEVRQNLDLGEYTDEKALNEFLLAVNLGQIQVVNAFITSTLYPITTLINERNTGSSPTVLAQSAQNCRKQIFSLLLKNGAQFIAGKSNPHSRDHLVPFDLGYFYRRTRTVTPLHIVALQSEEKWLLDIFDQFPQLLTPAVFTESLSKHVRYIIENDYQQLAVSIHEIGELALSEKDVACWSLLHWAACLGRTECISVLIEKGININMETAAADVTPLELACATGNLNVFKLLILHNATILNVCDMFNNTYLHIAASNGSCELTEYIVKELKMDVNAENIAGKTPLSLARLQVDSDKDPLPPQKLAMKAKCEELLITLGAKEDKYPYRSR